MAEGEITRFSAVFGCREVDEIGPVRSARLINFELVPEYKALFANSGASKGVSELLYETSSIPNIDDNAYHDAAFWRTDDRVAPHNLMTSTAGIRNAAAGAGFDVTASLVPLTFKDDTPAPAISAISVPYSAIVDVSYRYDPATNTWLRFIGGEAHMDAADGTQLAPKNVIIQFVEASESSIIEDEGGNHGMEYILIGTGKVQIFRDGQVIEGTWTRPDRDSVTQYVDAAGKAIPLNRGLTFVQVVPLGFQAAWS
jgi:hypothetical protein